MKTAIIPATLLALTLTACQHSDPGKHARTTSPSLPSAESDSKSTESRSLIRGIGPGHSSTLGRWRVQVSDDAGLHITQLSKSGQITITAGNWRARSGAFVFIENNQRVWAFDGEHNLFLLASKGDTLTSYGPKRFPYPIPPEVRDQMGKDAGGGKD